MRLRIVSGSLKGRVLSLSAKDNQHFRPTLERVREAVLEILKYDLQGSIVADLCAGSGVMGFEMLSRGAVKVDFVEKERRLSAQITKNAAVLKAEQRVQVFCTDVRSFIDSAQKRYNLIFFDPPYNSSELAELVPTLHDLLLPQGIVVYERRRHSQEKKSLKEEKNNVLIDKRVFGDTTVEIFRFLNY